MRITYDPEADGLAILLRDDATIDDSTDLEEGVTVWLDGKGHVVGLEVLDASERVGADPLSRIEIERLGAPTPAAT